MENSIFFQENVNSVSKEERIKLNTDMKRTTPMFGCLCLAVTLNLGQKTY